MIMSETNSSAASSSGVANSISTIAADRLRLRAVPGAGRYYRSCSIVCALLTSESLLFDLFKSGPDLVGLRMN